MFVEARKFLSLPSMGRGTRETDDVNSVEPKGLRMGLRAADVGPSLILKAWEPRVSEGQEEMDVSAQAEIELICPSFTFLFYSCSQWIGWWPSMFGRAICSTQFTNSVANLFQEHPHKHN